MRYRNILNLLVGSAAAQLLTLLSYPFLARLYSPRDFGVYGGVMGIVTILATLMRMRADKLVLFTKVDSRRRDLMLSFLLLNMLLAVAALLAVPLFDALLPAADTRVIVVGVAVAVVTSLVHFLMGVQASALKTRRLVQGQLIRNGITSLAQIAMFFLAWGALGLMAGTLVGLAAALLFQFTTARAERLLPHFPRLGRDKIRAGMMSNVALLSWGSLQGLAGSLANAAPLIFAAAAFSPATAGIYVIADRLVRIPVNLIVTTIRPYVAVHSRSSEGAPDIQFMLRLSIVLAIVAGAGLALVALFGEPLFALLLGGRWSAAGSVAAILFWFVLFAFASLPWQAYLHSLGRPRELIYIELAYVAARIGPMIVWREKVDLHTLALIVVFSHLLYSVLYYSYFTLAHRRGRLVSPIATTDVEPI